MVPTAPAFVRTEYKNLRPSGRNDGHEMGPRWFSAPDKRIGAGFPPCDATRIRLCGLVVAKMMLPLALQEPPRAFPVNGQISRRSPVATSSLYNLRSAKKAMD